MSACNVGDLGSIPGSGRSPGEGNGTPLQYSCLENPMDRGVWWVIVHRVAKSQTRLSSFSFLDTLYSQIGSPHTMRISVLNNWSHRCNAIPIKIADLVIYGNWLGDSKTYTGVQRARETEDSTRNNKGGATCQRVSPSSAQKRRYEHREAVMREEDSAGPKGTTRDLHGTRSRAERDTRRVVQTRWRQLNPGAGM